MSRLDDVLDTNTLALQRTKEDWGTGIDEVINLDDRVLHVPAVIEGVKALFKDMIMECSREWLNDKDLCDPDELLQKIDAL
jgi:hypothetical protein